MATWSPTRCGSAAASYLPYAAAPASVTTYGDVTIRPVYAKYVGADCDDPAGSYRLQQLVHDGVVGQLRSDWDAHWCDRGTRVANFGELRELVDTPGARGYRV